MSLRSLILLGAAVHSCLGAPALKARDECLSDDQAAQLSQQWYALLSQDAYAPAPQDVFTDSFMEYSSSHLYLDAACVQSDSIDSTPPWNKPVFSSLSDYQTYASSTTRAALVWHLPTLVHDCQNIAVRGYLTVQDDQTEINSVAMLGTQSDGNGGFKISSVDWEFDHASAVQVLVDREECKTRVVKTKLPTILVRDGGNVVCNGVDVDLY